MHGGVRMLDYLANVPFHVKSSAQVKVQSSTFNRCMEGSIMHHAITAIADMRKCLCISSSALICAGTDSKAVLYHEWNLHCRIGYSWPFLLHTLHKVRLHENVSITRSYPRCVSLIFCGYWLVHWKEFYQESISITNSIGNSYKNNYHGVWWFPNENEFHNNVFNYLNQF